MVRSKGVSVCTLMLTLTVRAAGSVDSSSVSHCACGCTAVYVGLFWGILICSSSVLLQDVSVLLGSSTYIQTQSTTNTISLPLFTYSVNTAHISPIENLIHYAEDMHSRVYHD